MREKLGRCHCSHQWHIGIALTPHLPGKIEINISPFLVTLKKTQFKFAPHLAVTDPRTVHRYQNNKRCYQENIFLIHDHTIVNIN